MKIFNVILHEGSYSDQCWNLMGSFSTEELAQKCIDNLCTPDPPPSNEMMEAAYLKYRQKIDADFDRDEARHEEAKAAALAVRDRIFKKANLFPEGSPERARLIIASYDYGKRLINEPFTRSPYYADFETWKRWQGVGVARCERCDLSIEEKELDSEPKFKSALDRFL